MKKIVLFFIYSLIVSSCSKETVGKSGGDTVIPPPTTANSAIYFANLPTYTNQPQVNFLASSIVDESRPIQGVDLYLNNPLCSGVSDHFISKNQLLNGGFNDNLNFNNENIYNYRIIFNDGEGECLYIKTIVHDNIAPNTPLLQSSVLTTNNVTIRPQFNNLSADVYMINFRENRPGGTTTNILRSLWASGGGYLTPPQNASTAYVVTFTDRAGNISNDSSLLTINQGSIPPEAPVLNQENLNGSLSVSSTIFISGSVDSGTTEIRVLAGYSDILVSTLTPAQFASGVNISLLNGLNPYKFIAIDQFSNQSEPKVISIYYNPTPNINYALESTNLTSANMIQVGTLSEFTLILNNRTMETNSSILVDVASVGISGLPPGMTVDTSKGCFSGPLRAGGFCEINLTANYATVGVKNFNFNITLDGNVFPMTGEVEVSELLIEETSEDTIGLGDFVKLSANKKFLIFNNGVMDLQLQTPTLLPAVIEKIKASTVDLFEYSGGFYQGKPFVVDNNYQITETASSKTYSGAELEAYDNDFALFLIDNKDGTFDFVNTQGVTQTVQSQSTPVKFEDGYLYYTSGELRKVSGQNLADTLLTEINIVGPLFFSEQKIQFFSGSGPGLYSYDGVIRDESTLAGASQIESLSLDEFIAEIAGVRTLYLHGEIYSNIDPLANTGDHLKIYNSTREKSVTFFAGYPGQPTDKTIIQRKDDVVATPFKLSLNSVVTKGNFVGYNFGKEGEFFATSQLGIMSFYQTKDYTILNYTFATQLSFAPESFISVSDSSYFSDVSGRIGKAVVTESGFSAVDNYYQILDLGIGEKAELVTSGDDSFLLFYKDLGGRFKFKLIRSF